VGQICDAATKAGRTAAVVRAAEWAADSRPDDDYLRRIHVRALLDAGRDAAAFDACRAALKSAGGNASYVRLAIEAASGANQLDDWIDELAASVTDEQEGGLPLAVAGQLDAVGAAQAVKLRQALATARPQDSARAWALAGSLRSAGRLSETVQTLVDFVRANPQANDLPRAQFSAWMRHFEAADDLLALIDTFSEDAKSDFASDFILGSLAAAAGHDTLAEKLLASCLKRRASFIPARVAWGEMLLNSYRWEGARKQAEAALQGAPKHAGAHFLLARARSGLDENDAAEESFEAALRYGPNEAEFALALARHHLRLHEWVRSQIGAERDHRLAAQRYYGEATALDPSDARAAEGLVSSYLRAGKLPIAQSRLASAEESGLADDALRRMRTMIEYFGREFSEAHLAELERQFERYPDDVATGRKLAKVYETRQRVDDAHRLVERLRRSSPDDDELMRLAARIDQRRLEYDQATALLEEQVRRYPRRRSALVNLAALYHNELRTDDARAALTRVLALDLDDREREQYSVALVATWYQVRDFDAALSYLDEWIADKPKSETAFRVRVNVLLFAGRHDEAVKASRVSGEAAPDNSQRKARLWWFADLCRDVRKPKLAARAYRELIDEGLSTLQLVLDLATALLRSDRPDEALSVLDDLLPPATAANFQIQRLRAQCDAKAGRVDAALHDLESMLDQPALKASRPELFATRQRLIVLLVGEQRFDRALELCEAWSAELDDRDGLLKRALLELRSSVLHSAGKMDDYLRVMEQLLELAAHDPGVNNDLGYTWVDRGEHLEQATRMIRKAVAAEPLNKNFLDSLGWAYYKAEDFSLARKYLRRSLRVLDGEDPVVRDHLADADYRLGDKDSARKNWQKSLDLIEAETADPPEAGRAELTASLRAKLKALEDGNEPAAAPVGGGER
ncbi:MAG: hypothetical protein IID33_11200, partial [Planctomycetes bacterium]|nr:hypothetical protein [Planctomycetota bacterium]